MKNNNNLYWPAVLATFAAFIVSSMLLVYIVSLLLSAGGAGGAMQAVFYFPNDTRWVMALAINVPTFYIVQRAIAGVAENKRTKNACNIALAILFLFNSLTSFQQSPRYISSIVVNSALCIYAFSLGLKK